MRKRFSITILAGIMIIACCTGNMGCTNDRTQEQEANLTEENQERLILACPPPKLDKSLERENLKKRLLRFNDENKVSYIYLISYGKVMSFHTIKGKVSSVNSKLTTGEQLTRRHTRGGRHVVESPQLDGSYGTNGDAVFFITTEGVYVEWNGEYMLCDQPLKMSTPPALIYTKNVR